MANERAPGMHRFCLPPGTRVGDWCVLGCHGHGAYGVVYRAVRVGQESAGPVALKVALYPWDPRFMREVALLSLIHHPSIPRLLGHGFWRHPSGTVFPFIVMEWVEGTPLYDWAREHHPTPRQLLQVLAQLARALQATHETSAIHRDVKGENVLVRNSDGRAVLTDFGAGNYYAAARVTWQPMPPGTPAYQSPESGLFQIRAVRSPGAHYMAGPPDDVFALGVTAYRLVTGDYPPSATPRMDEEGNWSMEDTDVRPPRELNPQVDPLLSELILRMLSLDPEARGTARELAETLEREIHEEQSTSEMGEPWSHAPEWRPWPALIIAGMVLLVWAWSTVRVHPEEAAAGQQIAAGAERPNVGTSDLGDSAPTVPLASVHVPPAPESIAQDTLPKPSTDQLRPDAKGQCPEQEQVPLNGGCWMELRTTDAKACERSGYVFFKARCYAPALAPRRKPQPTSEPMEPQ